MNRAHKHLPSCKILDWTKKISRRNKKRNLYLNSSGLQLCLADPLALLFTRRFHFFVASCTKFRCISNFAWWWKMTWTIHLYFCWNFRCTNLSVISNGNTVTPQGLVTQDTFSLILFWKEKKLRTTPRDYRCIEMLRSWFYYTKMSCSTRKEHSIFVWFGQDLIHNYSTNILILLYKFIIMSWLSSTQTYWHQSLVTQIIE